MEFPDWAPVSVVAAHKKMGLRYSEDDWRVTLLERLLTYPCMKNAWPQLEKRPQNRSLYFKRIILEGVPEKIFQIYENSARPMKNRAEESDRFTDISKSAAALAGLLERSMPNLTALDLYPEESMLEFLPLLRMDKVAGAYCRLEPSGYTPRDQVWKEGPMRVAEMAKKLPGPYRPSAGVLDEMGHSPILAVGKYGNSGTKNFFHYLVGDEHPKASVILGALSDYAKAAAEAAGTEVRVLSYQETENSRRTYFIRALSLYFEASFGGALKGTVASFASAALDEEISLGMAKAAIKNLK